MPFVRLDDQWLENPKVAQAGTLAAHLYSAGITYSNRHLADGFVPAGILNRLCDWSGVTEHEVPVTNQQLAERLVTHGLWTETEGGWLIHDYFDFQPSRAEVEAKRSVVSEARRAAGSKGGSKASSKRQANAKQTPSNPEANFKPQSQTQTQTQNCSLSTRESKRETAKKLSPLDQRRHDRQQRLAGELA